MTSILNFIRQREIGITHTSGQANILDNITLIRGTKPILADTPIHSRSTYLLRLNCNNKLFAAAHGDRSVVIYSALPGYLLATCEGHERSPWTLSFHPSDPFLLASGCLGGSIRLWNLKCLSKLCEPMVTRPPDLFTLSATRVWKQAGAIASLTFHPFHPILIVAWTQEVVFYDLISGRTLSIWRFASEYSRVRWVKLSPDGSLLYTATANAPENNALVFCSPRSSSIGGSSSNISMNEKNQELRNPQSPLELCRTKYNQQKDKRSSIARYELLKYLLTRPDSWYHHQGICRACSVRLCKWAATLGPIFPSQKNHLEQSAIEVDLLADGAIQARQEAALLVSAGILASPLPYAVEKLLVDEHMSDPHPAAVAIIEDLPAKEFLLSRGTYCILPNSSPGLFADVGMCCGGHAYDLLLTHRELMRHSLCRSCLQGFWRWTNGTVDWWTWISSGKNELPLAYSTPNCSYKNQEISTAVMKPLGESLHHPIGICLHCSISAKSSDIENPKSTLMPLPNDHNGCAGGTELTRCSPGPQPSVARVALKLLWDQLNNAREVTHITFLAAKIINDDKVTAHIRTLLNRQQHQQLSEVTDDDVLLPEFLGRKANKRSLKSTQRKTAKRKVRSRTASDGKLGSKSISLSESSDSDAEIQDIDHSNESLSSNFATEAAQLAKFVARAPWNRQEQVRIVSSSTETILASLPQPEPLLFSYMHAGHCLLNRQEEEDLPLQPTASQTKDTSRITGERSTEPVLAHHAGTLVCCKCGCIVTHTVPISPQSNLNHVVSPHLLFSEGPSLSSRSSREFPSRSLSTSSLDTSQTTTPTGTISVLNSVQQGISNVVAGLLYDMGDPGSAYGLQDTTYRVCRWELTLYEPVHPKPGDNNILIQSSSTSSLSHDTPSCPTFQSFMPANVAVSYNKNSLVVSHVRIFNDSSICLSLDGRLLGAFVVPQNNRTNPTMQGQLFGDRTGVPMENLLAVFRLEPNHKRGQYIYARKFEHANPVCLDFSPTGNMLVVGLSVTRLTANDGGGPYHYDTNSSLSSKVSSVAHIFKIPQVYSNFNHNLNQDHSQFSGSPDIKNRDRRRFRHVMREVWQLPHPRSMLLKQSSACLPASVEQWHRSLLLSSTVISVNTIVWCPDGGIIYGTTKGLIVMLKPQPTPINFEDTTFTSLSLCMEAEEIQEEETSAI